MKKLFSLVCTCLLAMSMQAAETDKYDALWDEFVAAVDAGNPQPYLDEVNSLIAKAMGK